MTLSICLTGILMPEGVLLQLLKSFESLRRMAGAWTVKSGVMIAPAPVIRFTHACAWCPPLRL